MATEKKIAQNPQGWQRNSPLNTWVGIMQLKKYKYSQRCTFQKEWKKKYLHKLLKIT